MIAQLVLCLCDFAKEALVGFWCVVEADEAETEGHERVGAEGDEQPPRELLSAGSSGMESFDKVLKVGQKQLELWIDCAGCHVGLSRSRFLRLSPRIHYGTIGSTSFP